MVAERVGGTGKRQGSAAHRAATETSTARLTDDSGPQSSFSYTNQALGPRPGARRRRKDPKKSSDKKGCSVKKTEASKEMAELLPTSTGRAQLDALRTYEEHAAKGDAHGAFNCSVCYARGLGCSRRSGQGAALPAPGGGRRPAASPSPAGLPVLDGPRRH